jgi:uncharacterized protein (TIGR00369 family)
MTAPTLLPRTPEQQAELDAALLDLFQRRITFNQTLGLQIQSVQPGDVRATFDMRPELVGHYAHGRLHGGVISATLDHMGGLAVIVGIAARHPHDTVQQVMARFTKVGTIDMRVDYLRQGLGRQFTVTAEVMRLGGRIGSTQMRLVNDEGTLLATGAAAYVVA